MTEGELHTFRINSDIKDAPRDRPILVDVIGTGLNIGQEYGWHIAERKSGGWTTGTLMFTDVHTLRDDEICRWCELPD